MKFLTGILMVLVVAMGCATDEQDLDNIMTAFEEQGIDEYCMVSVGTLHGERAIIIDTPMVVRSDNFEDCMLAYCTVLGCVGRAVDSDEGYMRVVTESLYIDMPMSGVHECIRLADAGEDVFDTLDENMEWVDR